MKKIFSHLLSLLIVLVGLNSIYYSQSKTTETNQNQIACEPNDFFLRLSNPQFANQMMSAMWTLSHDYSDFKRMEQVLNTSQKYFVAFEKNAKGDCSELKQLGGIKAFKDQLVIWLNDDDQSTRAYSAVMLGISGDKSYSHQLASLLKKRKYKEKDLIQYDRGRAAMALGMIGATEYKQNLVELLKSINEFDRVGAVIGLGYLKAKDQIPVIKKLLKDKDENVRQAVQEVLKLLGTSKSQKGKN